MLRYDQAIYASPRAPIIGLLWATIDFFLPLLGLDGSMLEVDLRSPEALR